MSTVGFYTDAGEQTNVSASVAAAEAAATASATSASGAATSEVNALSYSNNASTSANNAGTSETNASVSETSAAMSADDSANSAIASAASAVDANVSEGNALTSENNAAASAAAALVSENNAAATLAGALTKTNNLSDVSDVTTSRTNLDVYSKEETDKGRKNYLINGNFDIWQRGNSFTSPTGFKADRWQTSTDGDGITTSRVTSPNKDTPELRNLFRMTTNTTAVTAQAWNKIEGVNSLAGKRVTLSFRHRCTAACNMRARVQQAFGTGGSSTVTVLDEQVAYTSGYVTTTFSFDMPEITGKTVGVSDDDCVIVILTFQDFTGASVVCDLVYAQLEEGSVATPFEYRPIAEELALCQRYYIKYSASNASFAPIGILHMFSASTGMTTVNFPVTMRTVPTLSFSDAGDFRVIGGGTLTSIAGYTYSTAAEASLQGTISGLTAGDTTLLTFNGATDWFAADAEL